MDIKLNIDPAQINDAVAQLVLDSVLGETVKTEIKKAVEQVLRGGGYGYNSDSVIKQVVSQQVRIALIELWDAEFKQQVKAKLRAGLTDEHLTTIADASWQKLLNSIHN